jgi:ABC-type antimicrobial peptide transport system permease subunit
VTRLRAVLRTHDATLLPRDVSTMEALVKDAVAMDRFFMQLLIAFGTVALLISLLGLYGVISNAVAQRTRELGVRIALGASPRAVQILVLRQGLLLTSIGMIVGIVVALNLVRLLANVIYGVQPRDPLSFALAAALLAAAALAATWIPARRAVRADPLSALRAE